MRKPEIFWRFRGLMSFTPSLITPVTKGFRVNARIRKKLDRRKRRIQKRLDKNDLRGCDKPMLTASNIQYEIVERGRGIGYGGIGAMHLLVRKLGLAEAIDRRLHLLQVHLPGAASSLA